MAFLTNLVDFVKQDLCIDGNPLGDVLERVLFWLATTPGLSRRAVVDVSGLPQLATPGWAEERSWMFQVGRKETPLLLK